jgi:predicted CXXCH cytochrome family protein
MKRLFHMGIMSTLLLCSVIFLPASQKIFAETSPAASCITANCHALIGKDKYLHGPVAVHDCLVCHKETGKHTFLPINLASLCYACHDKFYTPVHKTAKEDSCTKCHSPHQSPNKFMLIG